jgi:hypothetical protein
MLHVMEAYQQLASLSHYTTWPFLRSWCSRDNLNDKVQWCNTENSKWFGVRRHVWITLLIAGCVCVCVCVQWLWCCINPFRRALPAKSTAPEAANNKPFVSLSAVERKVLRRRGISREVSAVSITLSLQYIARVSGAFIHVRSNDAMQSTKLENHSSITQEPTRTKRSERLLCEGWNNLYTWRCAISTTVNNKATLCWRAEHTQRDVWARWKHDRASTKEKCIVKM